MNGLLKLLKLTVLREKLVSAVECSVFSYFFLHMFTIFCLLYSDG
jgi:hypothetical protein